MIFAFGGFELDEERYELRHAGVPIKLEPKAFLVLTYLIRHRDRVVTRDELREHFWPGEFVTDSALAHCIVKARQAIGDGGMAPWLTSPRASQAIWLRACSNSPSRALSM